MTAVRTPAPLDLNLLLGLVPPSLRAELARKHAAGEGIDVADSRLLAERVLDCDKHGPWHPFAVDENGVVASVGNMCPACRAERLALSRFGEMSGVPRRYAESSFDNFEIYSPDQIQAVDQLRAYAGELAAGSSTNAILLGTPGTGKTHLAIAIAHVMASQRRSVVYTGMLDLLDRLRQDRFPSPPARAGEFTERVTRVDLLVIDEIGKQVGTESEAVAAQRIIDRRYAEQMPTVLVTNGAMDDVRDLITGAALERVQSDCVEVSLNWRSYREIQRAEPGGPGPHHR